jgi:hypothetical protein
MSEWNPNLKTLEKEWGENTNGKGKVFPKTSASFVLLYIYLFYFYIIFFSPNYKKKSIFYIHKMFNYILTTNSFKF